jgi:hypothetical protein
MSNVPFRATRLFQRIEDLVLCKRKAVDIYVLILGHVGVDECFCDCARNLFDICRFVWLIARVVDCCGVVVTIERHFAELERLLNGC